MVEQRVAPARCRRSPAGTARRRAPGRTGRRSRSRAASRPRRRPAADSRRRSPSAACSWGEARRSRRSHRPSRGRRRRSRRRRSDGRPVERRQVDVVGAAVGVAQLGARDAKSARNSTSGSTWRCARRHALRRAPTPSASTRPRFVAECVQPCGPEKSTSLRAPSAGFEALARLVVEQRPAGLADRRVLSAVGGSSRILLSGCRSRAMLVRCAGVMVGSSLRAVAWPARWRVVEEVGGRDEEQARRSRPSRSRGSGRGCRAVCR